MRAWTLPAEVSSWVTALSQVLHRRHAWRLLPLLVGLLFAQGRRTVSRWLRASGIGKGFQRYYYFLGSLGRKTDWSEPVEGLAVGLGQRVFATDARYFSLLECRTMELEPPPEGAS